MSQRCGQPSQSDQAQSSSMTGATEQVMTGTSIAPPISLVCLRRIPTSVIWFRPSFRVFSSVQDPRKTTRFSPSLITAYYTKNRPRKQARIYAFAPIKQGPKTYFSKKIPEPFSGTGNNTSQSPSSCVATAPSPSRPHRRPTSTPLPPTHSVMHGRSAPAGQNHRRDCHNRVITRLAQINRPTPADAIGPIASTRAPSPHLPATYPLRDCQPGCCSIPEVVRHFTLLEQPGNHIFKRNRIAALGSVILVIETQ